MKKIVIGTVAAAVMVAGAILVVAQRGHKGPGGFGRGGDHMLGMMAHGLGLTDDQKGKVKSIVDASRTEAEPLVQQLRDNHKNLETLGTDGTFDQAKTEALAGEQAAIMSKLIVERQKTKAQIFALLTDEQKAKAAEMRQKFGDRMKGRGFGEKRGESKEF